MTSDADNTKTETPVTTIWEQAIPQQDGSVVWEHNHIADGFREDQIAPEAISSEQRRSWANAKWRKFKARVVDSKLVRI